ncbi:MAG: AmmeMemoRadiSam system protein A [Armatimonadetes bacterium]|nr:AmmeMemoRadiSam system protein A [Armatimonadota bacterium]
MLCKAVRVALTETLTTGKEKVADGNVPEPFSRKAGVFVCIKKNGRLRGCMGTIYPLTSNILAEAYRNAVCAATRDPRFPPVTLRELPDLHFTVDILTAPEPISDESFLDPKRYGVIVRSGHRSGLLLPDLEGVDSPRQQVMISLQKGGIRPDEPYTLLRFEVSRYEEEI